MDWRTWVYGQLNNDLTLLALIPADQQFGSGALTGAPPNKHFLMVRLGETLPTIVPGVTQVACDVLVHDEPGDYMRIDDALKVVRDVLEGAPRTADGMVTAVWQGDSADQADDFFATITKTASFLLIGRK